MLEGENVGHRMFTFIQLPSQTEVKIRNIHVYWVLTSCLVLILFILVSYLKYYCLSSYIILNHEPKTVI